MSFVFHSCTEPPAPSNVFFPFEPISHVSCDLSFHTFRFSRPDAKTQCRCDIRRWEKEEWKAKRFVLRVSDTAERWGRMARCVVVCFTVVIATTYDKTRQNLIPISHLKIYSLLDCCTYAMREEICDLNACCVFRRSEFSAMLVLLVCLVGTFEYFLMAFADARKLPCDKILPWILMKNDFFSHVVAWAHGHVGTYATGHMYRGNVQLEFIRLTSSIGV